MESAKTNADWLSRLRASGDDQTAAITDLRNYLVKGLRSAYSGKGTDDAFCEDVAQEAVIKILDRLDQFAGQSRFTTWAMSIAIRMAVSEFRKSHFKNVSLNQFTGGEELKIEIPTNPAESPEAAAERRSILETLKELIDTQLTEKQRIAIQAGLGGMPVEEIAARTNSNRNAVYKLIYDGRQRLQRGMLQAGYSWTDIQTAIA